MAVKHKDGTEVEIGAGEAYIFEPGHDAWLVGDERFFTRLFSASAQTSASRRAAARCPAADQP